MQDVQPPEPSAPESVPVVAAHAVHADDRPPLMTTEEMNEFLRSPYIEMKLAKKGKDSHTQIYKKVVPTRIGIQLKTICSAQSYTWANAETTFQLVGNYIAFLALSGTSAVM